MPFDPPNRRHPPTVFDPSTPSYRAWRDRIRWLGMRNIEEYKTIPGFAVCMLDPEDGDDFFCTEARDEDLVFRVKQCDEWGQAAQDPAMFLFNGPTPILPGRYGKGTRDFPAQVLHDGAADRLPNGFPCGPLAGSWYLWQGLDAYTNISHDPTRAGHSAKPGTHTIIVAPGRQNARPIGTAVGAGSVDASAILSCAQQIPAGGNPPGMLFADADSAWRVYSSGLWYVHVSATISSTTAGEGTTLRITCFVDGEATYLRGWRKQSIGTLGSLNQPYYGGAALHTAENVSFGGPVLVEDASILNPLDIDIRNTSSKRIVVSDFIFTVYPFQVSRPESEATGNLDYDNNTGA